MTNLVPNSCTECLIRKVCGGHDLPLLQKTGCVSVSTPGHFRHDPNDMNPRHSVSFWEKWADVDGLLDLGVSTKIHGPESSDFPRYIPKLHDGSGRHQNLSYQRWIAVPLRKLLFTRKRADIGRKFENRQAICDYFKFSQHSKIFAVGVDHDLHIEKFWETHRSHRLPEILKRLGIDAVTAPNYSLFTDTTGFQMIRNLKRIFLVSQRLAESGLATIVHINAFRRQHWDIWRNFLEDHKEIDMVAKEFETGAGKQELESLAELQAKIGRPIHPVLIGGGRLYSRATELFAAFTILDSRPFQSAIHREALTRIGSTLHFLGSETILGAPIDELLENNIRLYPEYLERAEIDGPAERPGPKDHPELDL